MSEAIIEAQAPASRFQTSQVRRPSRDEPHARLIPSYLCRTIGNGPDCRIRHPGGRPLLSCCQTTAPGGEAHTGD